MALTGPRESGYESDLVAEARRAARQAGLSLNEWLEKVAKGTAAQRPHTSPAADLIAELHARLDELELRGTRKAQSSSGADTAPEIANVLEQRLRALARKMEEPVARRDQTLSAVPPFRSPQGDWRSGASEPLKDLKAAIAEIAARQQTLEREFDQTFSGHADRIDHRMDVVAERLERQIGEASPSGAIRDLEAEVRAVSARLDHDRASAADQMREELVDLVRRLDEVPARVADDLAPRLEDTARRLDTATRAEVDAIRVEMREIAQEIDRVTRSEFKSLHAEIAKLTERVEEAAQADRTTSDAWADEASLSELAAIREDIRRLESGLDDGRKDEYAALRKDLLALSEQVANPPERLHDLERHFGLLAERLNARSDPSDGLAEIERQLARLAERLETPDDAGAAGFSDIERQITQLAERLDGASGGGGEGLAEIERQLIRLADQVDDSSRRLAGLSGLERTIGELYRRIEQDRGSVELVAALKQELSDLRTNVDAADRRNQDTLGAVHETLTKIVDRLTDLEEEVEEVSEETRHAFVPSDLGDASTALAAPRAAPDEKHLDPGDLAGRIEAVARAFDREVEDNTPLAPGSGRPDLTRQPDQAQPVPHDRDNFIAAARRAAQAASAEQFQDFAPAGRQPSKLARLFPVIASRRSLILALGVLVLAAGAATAVALLGDPGRTGELPQADPAADVSMLEAPAAGQQDLAGATASTKTQHAAPEPLPPRIVPLAKELDDLATGTVTPPDDKDDAIGEAAADGDETAKVASSLPVPQIGSDKLREAAAAGDPAAQFEIAARYTDGRGVAQDFAKAAKWYLLAAGQGSAPAQYRLGSLYEKGHGVTRDPALAKMWYRRAAEQGNRKAMHNLAVLHADGSDGEPDFEQAALWFRQASEHGLKDSQYNLGVLYGRGLGTELNLAEAFRWFAIAAAQGDTEAAAKRDEIAQELDEQTLAELELALQSWRPKPLIAQANAIPSPEEGWDDATPAAPPPAMDARALVRQAQSLLAELGYQPGPADGEAGARTREAVITFQREIGLPETGEITPDLVDELQHLAG